MKKDPNRKKKGKKKFFIIGGVVVAGGAFALHSIAAGKNAAGSEMMQTALIEKTDLRQLVTVSGTVCSSNVNELASDNAGSEVKSVKVKVGDRVKKGDVIAVLDDTELKKKLETAEQSLEAQKKKNEIDLNSAKRGYDDVVDSSNTASSRSSRAVDKAAKAYNDAVDQDNEIYEKYIEAFNARVELEQAANQANAAYEAAYQVLVEKNAALSAANLSGDAAAVSRATDELRAAQAAADEALENSENMSAALEAAAAAEAKLEAALEAANEKVYSTSDALTAANDNNYDSSRQSQKAVADGKDMVDSAKIGADTSLLTTEQEIALLKEQIKKCTIKSEIDGIVTAVNVKEGKNFAGGVIATVQDDSDLMVSAEVDQYDISKIAQEMSTDITVGALGKEPLDGTLSFVAPVPAVKADALSASENTGTKTATYSIESKFKQKDDRLRIGMTAKIDIILDEADDVLVVPIGCLQGSEEEGFFVTVITDEATGETKEIKVDCGLQNDYYSVISGVGIKEGMNVVMPEIKEADTELGFY